MFGSVNCYAYSSSHRYPDTNSSSYRCRYPDTDPSVGYSNANGRNC